MLWKSKKKDLPKQYTVWAKDLKDGGEDIQRSGDDGFPLFAIDNQSVGRRGIEARDKLSGAWNW